MARIFVEDVLFVLTQLPLFQTISVLVKNT